MHRHIAPTYLSDQMKSAVKSCEQEVETDIEWARRASRGWGKWGSTVVKMIEDMGEDKAFRGASPLWDVEESDLESDVGSDGRWVSEGEWDYVVGQDEIEDIFVVITVLSTQNLVTLMKEANILRSFFK